jgi:hypothetical protein
MPFFCLIRTVDVALHVTGQNDDIWKPKYIKHRISLSVTFSEQ